MGCDGRYAKRERKAIISIHAPQWGATGSEDPYAWCRVISIHAPQWGATRVFKRLNYLVGISIHAPQWGATCWFSVAPSAKPFQSTHPSGVRPHFSLTSVSVSKISIHAPQWGATTIWTVPNMRLDISIHAPQWGATCHVGAVLGPHIHFNPRTPVGCDRAGQRQAGRWHPISIHAPQWGATQSQEARGADRFHFNPRTPVGCDDSRVVARQGRGLFQSTHPSGVRQHDAPRKHRCGISIHAPQWGATEPSADPPRRGEYFNPRTPVGCD